MEEKKQQCDIELDRDVAQGTYSNLVNLIYNYLTICK